EACGVLAGFQTAAGRDRLTERVGGIGDRRSGEVFPTFDEPRAKDLACVGGRALGLAAGVPDGAIRGDEQHGGGGGDDLATIHLDFTATGSTEPTKKGREVLRGRVLGSTRRVLRVRRGEKADGYHSPPSRRLALKRWASGAMS